MKKKKKNVLVTGHTGFKGSWLSCFLNYLGAKVSGVSIDVPTNPSMFEITKDIFKNDIRIDLTSNKKEIKKIIRKINPEFVFHLAAQPLVSVSYENPFETFNTNAIGTINLLDTLREINKQICVVLVTSDKSYFNKEWVYGYRENDLLGGKDPYSASKAMTELAIKSYFESFFSKKSSKVKIAVARAGNVIGGGDWAKDRLVPDCIKAWSKKNQPKIRNPKSTRPWQHVLEPLGGYLVLAYNLKKNNQINGEAFNFGPSQNEDKTVDELLKEMKKNWKHIKWKYLKGDKVFKESSLLRLNCDKAHSVLDWKPTFNFSETIKLTSEWYQTFYDNKFDNKKLKELTFLQIQKYLDQSSFNKIF